MSPHLTAESDADMVVGSFRPFPAARPAGAARAGYLPLPAAGLVRGDARRATNPVGREIFGIAEPGFNRRVKKQWNWPSPRLLRAIVVSAVALLLATVILLGPRLIVDLDIAGRALDGAKRVEATGQARQMLTQVIAGIAILLGSYAAVRRLRVSEAELQVSRDGQVTERFTRAVEHLGATNADVRIGGIYALERIARNSPTDGDAVTAILCAFVRSHAPWPALPPTADPDTRKRRRIIATAKPGDTCR